MKKGFQGKIVIRNGEIVSQKKEPGFVKVEIDGELSRFDSCWAYPGLIDSHGHIAALGESLIVPDLSRAKSPEDCVEILKKSKSAPDKFIIGKGWNQESWKDKNFPAKEILDAEFLDIPVFLLRIDGHAAWVNSKALELARISEHTINPNGGEIRKTKSGKPNGILRDNAINLVKDKIPKPSEDKIKNYIKSALKNLAHFGLTATCDMDLPCEQIAIFKELDKANQLPLTVTAYVNGHKNEWLKNETIEHNGDKFHVKGIKLYADGSLGSRSAALLEPYEDSPKEKGIFLINEKELFEKSKIALERGLQVAVHAIGDAANRMALKVFEKLREERIADPSSILRLEHAQHIHPSDLDVFSKQRIFASVQPIQCISDAASISENRLGRRIEYSYPWKSLLEAGAELIAGSDYPIESHNPVLGIDAFVNRKPFSSNSTWTGKEKLSLEEALEAYSQTPKKIFEPKRKSCDITILNNKLEDDLSKCKPVAAVSDGKFAFK